ncbi:Rrp12-like protein [Thalictrum thalictroides]|uniref:Rrp12-like protein n=1 Tax=Thalictrum thalictroides TaxID=46969 RepID=A0A7J6VM29_THATH|nr:Rrp12-like protein [Thalictrum thalictroides]
MDTLEINEIPSSYDEDIEEDICTSILSRFSKSTLEEHQHLCAVVGAMSQELKDQKLPLTPIIYFGAITSSLKPLSIVPNPSDPVIPALLTFLSTILPKISVSTLRKKRGFVSEPVVRIIRTESMSAAAVIPGIKCISHLLVISEKVNYNDVNQLYENFAHFITDSRLKVRKQSHLCLRDVLQSFHKSAALVGASKNILDIFQSNLLLAGQSNNTDSGKPKGAEEVLHILDALKDCLPLMSMDSITSFLKHFENLLTLRQPLVTRRIADCLHVLCLNSSSEVAPKILRDLLCSLAVSVSRNEKSVDSMTFAARLLDVGIRKVYSLNRDICVARLPVVFHALGEILACEREEAVFAAMEAFKGLIFSCIDGGLIKQELEQLRDDDGDTRQSGSTIEKICATVGGLLEYRYNAVWDISLKVVSAMFDKLGEYSYQLLRGAVKSMENMQKMEDEALQCRKQLHECFGSALGAMGPKFFLVLLPLNLEAPDPSEVSCWLFPILKQYTVGGSLSYFRKSILGKAKAIRQKSRKLEQEGRIYSSRNAEALIYSLWSLLPAFCNYPIDTASSFKDLEKELCDALRDEPDVRGIVCSSLQILIQQNKRLLEENNDINDEMSIPVKRARAKFTPQVAADNLSTLKSSAHEFLSVLSDIFMESSADNGGCLQSTIGEFASISEKKVVRSFFLGKMKELRDVTQKAVKAEQRNSMEIEYSANGSSLLQARAHLLDLAVSFRAGLDPQLVDLLFTAIKPALQDDEGLIQKKAYKILSYILKDLDEFLLANLDDLLRLMIEVRPSSHFSAKRHRLDCLYFLIVHISKDASEQRKQDIIGSFITEIILALKEANKKTRNRAYEIIVQIGHAIGDEEQGGKRENLQRYFNLVAGGLAGETPHMISAAVTALARLAYEFSDLVSTAYNVLPSAFLLLQRKNREIIKANLGLVKVLVAKSHAEGLQIHLKSLVEGLLKWQDDQKNHFKAKVKKLLEMLVKKCGVDAVKAVMPEEHMKLLTNIRKMNERKERRDSGDSEIESRSVHSKATTSRSRWNHTKIFSDFGDEDSEEEENMGTKASRFNSKMSTIRSKQTRRATATKSLPEDLFDQLEDDPLDFLDQQKVRSALQASDRHLKRKQVESDDDDAEIDMEGRLVIREGGRPKKEKTTVELDAEAGSRKGSNQMSSKSLKKRRKTSDSGWAYTGNEYATKKARGDVKRKDKLEPYAYWPLDRKMMSRRPEHRAAARKGMASVANPLKLVTRIKKIQEDLASTKVQCRELLSAKQDLIDKASTVLVGNRSLVQRMQASSGIPSSSDSDDPAYTNLKQIIDEWTLQFRSQTGGEKQDFDSEDINQLLFSAVVKGS